MKTITYKITKANSLFNLRVNDTFIIRNNQCFKKFVNETMFTRCTEYDNFDFNIFVTAGVAEMTVKEESDSKYQVGDLVVYNIDGPQNIYMERPVHKNQVCRVDNVMFSGKTIYYKLTNINTREQIDQRVKETSLPSKSAMYWFIDSHGHIKSTYFFLRTYEDAYRFATNNIFYSYAATEKQLNENTASIDYMKLNKIIGGCVNCAMKIDDIYNKYIDSTLENIAESYKEQCDNPMQAIADENDECLIAYIYNDLKQYIENDYLECLMDCVVEHFADVNVVKRYKEKMIKFLAKI